MPTQDLRPGLLSAVPAGLKPEPAALTQTLKAVLLPTIYGTAEAVPFVESFPQAVKSGRKGRKENWD
jgi:hypothetical protein